MPKNKNINILFDISMEASLEGNTQETKCMSMTCHVTKTQDTIIT